MNQNIKELALVGDLLAIQSVVNELEIFTEQWDGLIFQMRYILEQTHVGHIHDAASAAIAAVRGAA